MARKYKTKHYYHKDRKNYLIVQKVKSWVIMTIIVGSIPFCAYHFIKNNAVDVEAHFVTPEAGMSAELVVPTMTPSPTPTAVPTPDPTKGECGERCQVMKYMVEKFGDHAADGIAMLRKCENSTLGAERMNTSNNNGTWDVGVFQMNVHPDNRSEVERLKDYKYNIDRAWEKFKNNPYKPYTFYYWTCGYEVGHITYLNVLRGEVE